MQNAQRLGGAKYSTMECSRPEADEHSTVECSAQSLSCMAPSMQVTHVNLHGSRFTLAFDYSLSHVISTDEKTHLEAEAIF